MAKPGYVTSMRPQHGLSGRACRSDRLAWSSATDPIPRPEGRGRLYEIPRSEVQDLTRTLRSVISDMCRHISPDAAAHAMRLSADTGERCTVYYGLTNGKGSIFV